ncbi:MAG: hypothetical protein M3421_15000 [Bacteroidota bacterium]|jgi:phosphoribosyl 1,2-cyclic phosphodiesterase|nr:hypothetical protein [Bacteroidota bacterium]
MGKWQKVYSTNILHRAEIVKAVLEDQGLQPVIISKKDQLYHFGHYEVHASPEDVIKAIKIIKDDIQFE